MSFQTKFFLLSVLVASAFCGQTIINEGGFILDTFVFETNFTIRITANTTGYVGFGISTNGQMQGSDLVIGGYNGTSNQSYIGDYFSSRPGAPAYDLVQNVQLLSASENATHTTLEFTRNLNTTDLDEDLPIMNSTQYILWSIGSGDGIEYHATRGSVQLNLFEG